MLSAEELEAILRGLDQIGEQAADSTEFVNDAEAEDVHHFVEKQLVALIGDAGYKLHSGRSRNEQIATDLRIYVRAGCDEISEALATLISTFLDPRGTGGPSRYACIYAYAAGRACPGGALALSFWRNALPRSRPSCRLPQARQRVSTRIGSGCRIDVAAGPRINGE